MRMMKSPMAVRNPSTSGETETQKRKLKLLLFGIFKKITVGSKNTDAENAYIVETKMASFGNKAKNTAGKRVDRPAEPVLISPLSYASIFYYVIGIIIFFNIKMNVVGCCSKAA